MIIVNCAFSCNARDILHINYLLNISSVFVYFLMKISRLKWRRTFNFPLSHEKNYSGELEITVRVSSKLPCVARASTPVCIVN